MADLAKMALPPLDEFLRSRSVPGRVARVSDSQSRQHGACTTLHPEHHRAREDPGKPVGS